MGLPPEVGCSHWIEIEAELADKIVGVSGFPGVVAAIIVTAGE
jgi:hypothetical protein